MVDIDDFLIDVQAEVEKCPYPIILNAVRQAAREFCRRTHVHQEEAEFIQSLPNTQEYVMEATNTNFQVIALKRLRVNEVTLVPKTLEWLTAHVPNWRTDTSETGSSYYTHTSEDTFHIIPFLPPLAAPLSMDATYALQPAPDAQKIVDFLYDRHLEKIANGAKYRLLRMVGAKWANPKMAGMYGNLFYRECANVRAQVEKSFTPNEVIMQAPKFA